MGIEILEQVSASKKLGADEARELIVAAATVHITKGKKLDVFDGGKATDEIVTKMLGTTGNLRAPTVKAGDQLLVGYNEEIFQKVLG
jgi:hypothetical protein